MDPEQTSPESPSDETSGPAAVPDSSLAIWRYARLTAGSVVLVSVLGCIVMAAARSRGLTVVTVTALNKEAEPKDHGLPLIRQHDALPDYEILINRDDDSYVRLGAKPNQSATEGLTWKLSEPISVSEIASVRLQDQDKLVSDVIAEVQITDSEVVTENYRFEFQSERSVSVGFESFFRTPIGKAISVAFLIAILTMLLSFFGFL